MIQIFGYGSLINIDSARVDAPELRSLTPSYIQGFRRDFSFWDKDGFRSIPPNEDVAGVAHCALDVHRADEAERVNGVVFEVSGEYYQNLISREGGYQALEIEVYEYADHHSMGRAYVFSADSNDGVYDLYSKAQQRYLEICLAGARACGEQFYAEFLDTTFVGLDSLRKFMDDNHIVLE